jgi:beta-N-acetylhexosaminidase
MIRRFSGTAILLLLTFSIVAAQDQRQKWVDSLFQKLDEEEKIAQLLIVPLSSDWEKNKLNDIERQVENKGIGGLLFTSGKPLKQVSLVNDFQASSRIPVLVGMDAPNGLGEILDSTIVYPNTLSLGAVSSDSLIFDFGKEVGRQLRVLGVNFNLSPVANLANNNDITPEQNTFGQFLHFVSQRSVLVMKGLASQGILSCAKYFPVQGMTVTDVEKGFPVVKTFVDSVQAFPFEALIDNGITCIMPAASQLPLFYETKTSARKNKYSNSLLLSASFAGDWVKKQMHFNGVVIVDARPVEKNESQLKNGDAELFAFQTGNELVITDYPEATIRKIKRLLKKQPEYRRTLDIAVRKVLDLKYDAGLLTKPRIKDENVLSRLNTPEARILQQTLFRSSVTVTRNDNNTLPLKTLENKKIAVIVVGDTSRFSPFYHYISKYAKATKIEAKGDADSVRINAALASHDVVIVGFTSQANEKLVTTISSMLISKRSEQELIIANMGSPFFSSFANQFQTVITCFTDHPEILKGVPQIIFGGIGASGLMPLTKGTATEGFGIQTKPLRRFEYTNVPEDAGMSSRSLRKIESIAMEAINNGATPGCHVLVAKDGKVVYEKSFGYLTYEKQIPVTDSTIYDLASVTKVSATLQTVMFMHDRGLIDINKKASVYLPELKNSNKENFTLKDILTHQAGLWPFLPFWAQTMKDSLHLPEFYQNKPSLEYPYLVADNLYATKSMKDSLWTWIIKAKIREKPTRTPYDYRYSDMGFYILQRLAERILNQQIDDFLDQNLYEPLGAYTMGYLPLLRFRVTRIAPTEQDRLFRKTLLIGTVHDQGAAMHGGVAGHAGLFSTANDLAKLGQMLLQEGYYGGYQYYRPETVRIFTNRQFETSRRGLGWDKPVQSDWNSPTSLFSSPRTFGHTGFTGTCIWVDPEFNLVYVFLSNRVHPDMTNNKLLNSNIRSRIQDVIYQSIFDYCNTGKHSGTVNTNF